MLNIKPPDYKFCPFCGRKLGTIKQEGKEYKHCFDDNWTYYPSVYQSSNAIIVKDGKILLTQRARKPYKGKWMLPAGFISFGEHPRETVIREVEEETGLTAKNPVFFDILQTQDDPRAMGNFAFFYKVEAEGEIQNRDVGENLNVGWFDLNKVPEMAWRNHKRVIKRLLKEWSNSQRGE